MKISDLDPSSRDINIIFKVISKSESRDVTSRKTGEQHTVCDALVGDETGTIIMSLWNDDIDLIEEESVYELANGRVNIFRDSLRLTRGRDGLLTESKETIEEVDTENARSEEVHRRPQRRSYGRDSYGRSSGRRDSGSRRRY